MASHGSAVLGLRLNWPLGWEIALESHGAPLPDHLINHAISRLFPDRIAEAQIVRDTSHFVLCRLLDPQKPEPQGIEIRDNIKSYAVAMKEVLEREDVPSAVTERQTG